MSNNKLKIEIEGLDEEDLDSLLHGYVDLNKFKESIDEKSDYIKNKITEVMKKKKWYLYKTKKKEITANFMTEKKDTINKSALKMLLTEQQYNQVVVTKSNQKLLIVSSRDRERLNKYVKKE